MAGSPHLLMLLRHAIAEEPSAARHDEERRLTGEGKRKLREVVAGMRALELPVDVVLSSPLRRAVETAEIVADGYGSPKGVTVTPALAPDAGLDAVFAGAIQVQGHLDVGLGRLALHDCAPTHVTSRGRERRSGPPGTHRFPRASRW